MRTYLLFIFLLSFLDISGQTIQEKDIDKYLKAYSYILNDSCSIKGNLYISSFIVDLDRFWFIDNVRANKKDSMDLSNSLESRYNWFEDFYSTEINQSFKSINCKTLSSGNNSTDLLFFSTIKNNSLRVDVFINYKGKMAISNIKFHNLIFYGENVYSYLFFFDDNNIRSTYKLKMHSD